MTQGLYDDTLTIGGEIKSDNLGSHTSSSYGMKSHNTIKKMFVCGAVGEQIKLKNGKLISSIAMSEVIEQGL